VKRWLLAFVLVSVAPLCHAHKPSDSYLALTVNAQDFQGQWDIALRDLDFAIGLDINGDGAITWGELRARGAEVTDYALSRLSVSSGSTTCQLLPAGNMQVDNHTDGAYAILRFNAECSSMSTSVGVTYGLLFDIDPQHRGLLRLNYGDHTESAIFSPENNTLHFAAAATSRMHQFVTFVHEGIWHIWIGYDHILFLLSLLLPAVLRRQLSTWQPKNSFRIVLVDVVKVVTAFTVAHSITLSLAALNIVNLPSRWVESGIATSVVLAALNNLYPIVDERRWLMGFIFGLIHGLGFASVLRDLGLPSGSLLLTLFGFNFGVEIGQLAIVSAFLPVAYVLRATQFYQQLAVRLGSLAIALLGSAWLLERSLNLKIL
jgi:hypothetical protein